MEVFHGTATECHLPGWYSIYLARRDGRLSWPSWLDSAPAGSRTSDLSIRSPTLNHCTTKATVLTTRLVYRRRHGSSMGAWEAQLSVDGTLFCYSNQFSGNVSLIARSSKTDQCRCLYHASLAASWNLHSCCHRGHDVTTRGRNVYLHDCDIVG